MAPPARRGQRALQALPVPLGRPDPVDPTGAMDLKDPQDLRVQQVPLEPRARKDRQDCQGWPALQVR